MLQSKLWSFAGISVASQTRHRSATPTSSHTFCSFVLKSIPSPLGNSFRLLPLPLPKFMTRLSLSMSEKKSLKS